MLRITVSPQWHIAVTLDDTPLFAWTKSDAWIGESELVDVSMELTTPSQRRHDDVPNFFVLTIHHINAPTSQRLEVVGPSRLPLAVVFMSTPPNMEMHLDDITFVKFTSSIRLRSLQSDAKWIVAEGDMHLSNELVCTHSTGWVSVRGGLVSNSISLPSHDLKGVDVRCASAACRSVKCTQLLHAKSLHLTGTWSSFANLHVEELILGGSFTHASFSSNSTHVMNVSTTSPHTKVTFLHPCDIITLTGCCADLTVMWGSCAPPIDISDLVATNIMVKAGSTLHVLTSMRCTTLSNEGRLVADAALHITFTDGGRLVHMGDVRVRSLHLHNINALPSLALPCELVVNTPNNLIVEGSISAPSITLRASSVVGKHARLFADKSMTLSADTLSFGEAELVPASLREYWIGWAVGRYTRYEKGNAFLACNGDVHLNGWTNTTLEHMEMWVGGSLHVQGALSILSTKVNVGDDLLHAGESFVITTRPLVRVGLSQTYYTYSDRFKYLPCADPSHVRVGGDLVFRRMVEFMNNSSILNVEGTIRTEHVDVGVTLSIHSQSGSQGGCHHKEGWHTNATPPPHCGQNVVGESMALPCTDFRNDGGMLICHGDMQLFIRNDFVNVGRAFALSAGVRSDALVSNLFTLAPCPGVILSNTFSARVMGNMLSVGGKLMSRGDMEVSVDGDCIDRSLVSHRFIDHGEESVVSSQSMVVSGGAITLKSGGALRLEGVDVVSERDVELKGKSIHVCGVQESQTSWRRRRHRLEMTSRHDVRHGSVSVRGGGLMLKADAVKVDAVKVCAEDGTMVKAYHFSSGIMFARTQDNHHALVRSVGSVFGGGLLVDVHRSCLTQITSPSLHLLRDDGEVRFVDGVEVYVETTTHVRRGVLMDRVRTHLTRTERSLPSMIGSRLVGDVRSHTITNMITRRRASALVTIGLTSLLPRGLLQRMVVSLLHRPRSIRSLVGACVEPPLLRALIQSGVKGAISCVAANAIGDHLVGLPHKMAHAGLGFYQTRTLAGAVAPVVAESAMSMGLPPLLLAGMAVYGVGGSPSHPLGVVLNAVENNFLAHVVRLVIRVSTVQGRQKVMEIARAAARGQLRKTNAPRRGSVEHKKRIDEIVELCGDDVERRTKMLARLERDVRHVERTAAYRKAVKARLEKRIAEMTDKEMAGRIMRKLEDCHVDHIIDLQLGGVDGECNMSLLDKSDNMSLGSQISNQLRGVPHGTKVVEVILQDNVS